MILARRSIRRVSRDQDRGPEGEQMETGCVEIFWGPAGYKPINLFVGAMEE